MQRTVPAVPLQPVTLSWWLCEPQERARPAAGAHLLRHQLLAHHAVGNHRRRRQQVACAAAAARLRRLRGAGLMRGAGRRCAPLSRSACLRRKSSMAASRSSRLPSISLPFPEAAAACHLPQRPARQRRAHRLKSCKCAALAGSAPPLGALPRRRCAGCKGPSVGTQAPRAGCAARWQASRRHASDARHGHVRYDHDADAAEMSVS